MPRYFAYGSNLSVPQMQRRCPGALPGEAARLPGHHLAFAGVSKNWAAGGVATIVPSDPAHSVPGRLYTLDEAALLRLDVYEGSYDRIAITVGHETVWTYRRRSDLPRNAPSLEYFAIMAHAYGTLGFDLAELVAALPIANAHPPNV